MTTADTRDGRRLTARGTRTRARIIAAAADLICVRGIGNTTLDNVLAASGVSKSQLYHHFAGKEPLVRAAIEQMGEFVIKRERDSLARVSTMRGLRRWRDSLVETNAVRHGAYGCTLGSLASEVSDHDEALRQTLSAYVVAWQNLLAGVLHKLRDRGELPADAPVDQLAAGVMGALQGGCLLARTARDVTFMATSLDMALAYLESLSGR